MNTSNPLADRGILPAANDAGWHVKQNRWHYPLYGKDGTVIGYRSKAIDRNDPDKYRWVKHNGRYKPDDPYADWYILPGTGQHIKNADGVVYIANGEVSCLSHVTARVYHTIATTLSEVSVPENTLTVLNELGVSRVIYLADNDNAGYQAAINWRDALRGSGIDYEARQRGVPYAKGYDSNDAWMESGFDETRFRHILDIMPVLELPEPVEKKDYAIEFESDSEGLVRAIESALNLEGRFTHRIYQQQWRQLRCPHHDDKDPSAGFNIHSGVINCQVCGSHSPYETASLLGIDISPYRGKPKKKKLDKSGVSTKPERLEPIQLPDVPQDTRSYEQIIDDEIMALNMAYEAGQRVSWIAQDDLPVSWVSAMLNLSSARSSLAAVWVKMHHAFRKGTLKPVFTIQDVVKATGYSTKLCSNVVGSLLEMNFMHFLRTVSKDTLSPKKVTKSGRPPALYAINHDSGSIQCSLNKMLEKYVMVQKVNRAIAKDIYDLQVELELSDEDFIPFKERAKAVQNEPVNADANRAYTREMFGNGKEWRGWTRALALTDYSIPLAMNSFDNSKELRVQLALWWIEHVRNINSREDWKRILGCSDPTIDSVFAAAHINTIQQSEKLEFDAPRTVKAMERLYINTQREYRGKVWKISYKLKGETGWNVSSEHSYKRDFIANLGQIEKVFMILTTPSKQVLMSAEEIAYLESEQEDEIIPGFEPVEVEPEVTIPEMETVEPQAVKPKTIPVMRNEHIWTTFPYQWKFRQLQLMIHVYTDYRLSNDGMVLDTDNQRIRGRTDLHDIVLWFNSVASDSQQRTTASFYGDNHDDEAEMKELQAIERIWLFEINYSERIAPILIARATIQKLATYSRAGALDVQPILEPDVVPDVVEQQPVLVTKVKPYIHHDFNRNKDGQPTKSRFAHIVRGA